MIATNRDQVKYLLNLGIDSNTADCYILWMSNHSDPAITTSIIPEGLSYNQIKDNYSCSIAPCWSRFAIQKLLPSYLNVSEEIYNLQIDNRDIKYVTSNGNVLICIKDNGDMESILTALSIILVHGYN
jgi:hypothetical protein